MDSPCVNGKPWKPFLPKLRPNCALAGVRVGYSSTDCGREQERRAQPEIKSRALGSGTHPRDRVIFEGSVRRALSDCQRAAGMAQEMQVDFGLGAPIEQDNGKTRRSWMLRVVHLDSLLRGFERICCLSHLKHCRRQGGRSRSPHRLKRWILRFLGRALSSIKQASTV
jgi:hypothetical protein